MAKCMTCGGPVGMDGCPRCVPHAIERAKELVFVPAPLCNWFGDDSYDTWETECGQVFQLSNDSTLDENNFAYCPYCGKRINEVNE